MQDNRLKNVMELVRYFHALQPRHLLERQSKVFNTVNIEDSKQIREMTSLSIRDNAAMKQIAFLTMLYLPASMLSVSLFSACNLDFEVDDHSTVVSFQYERQGD